jgi:hypothetical protein
VRLVIAVRNASRFTGIVVPCSRRSRVRGLGLVCDSVPGSKVITDIGRVGFGSVRSRESFGNLHSVLILVLRSVCKRSVIVSSKSPIKRVGPVDSLIALSMRSMVFWVYCGGVRLIQVYELARNGPGSSVEAPRRCSAGLLEYHCVVPGCEMASAWVMNSLVVWKCSLVRAHRSGDVRNSGAV